MGWKGITAYILFIGVGYNLAAVVMLGEDLRSIRFLIMIILLIFALFFAILTIEENSKKRERLENELDKKREIIKSSKREIKKLLS